jgi:hypothetical protein
VLAVGTVLVLALAAASVVYVLSDDENPEAQPVPRSSRLDVTIKPATKPAKLEATRVVDVDGKVVTVRETTRVAAGGPIIVAPSHRKLAVGLSARKAVVAGEDGSTEPFMHPTPVAPGRSITIVGTYKLADCPDLLPIQWPSPIVIVPGRWSRTYIRNEAPVRTAQAICKSAKSTAKNLSVIRGVMTKHRKPTVRLTWRDSRTLTVQAIGSASGVAAIGHGRRCADDCVATAKPRSTFQLSLRPLERCAIGGKSNQLTLRVSVGNNRPRTISLNVRELGRTLCKASAR